MDCGIKNCDDNILEDENLLDCHRKELIGTESAKDILLAINLNVNNLLNELRNKKYFVVIVIILEYVWIKRIKINVFRSYWFNN